MVGAGAPAPTTSPGSQGVVVNRTRVAITVVLVAGLLGQLGGGLLPAIVLANGIGDLYAGIPGGLLELHAASASVVSELDFMPGPSSLAFSNNGRTLWAARGQRAITRIDIDSISMGAPIELSGPAVALTVPEGPSVLVAIQGANTLAIVDPASGLARASQPLPAAPDLLASDRRDSLVVAARRGDRWVSIVDPASGTNRTLNVEGSVVGLAVDRAGNIAYVLTSAPPSLWRIRLRDPKVLAHVDLGVLPVPPSSLVATRTGPVVSAGRELWLVGATDAHRLAQTGATVAAMAVSDDGSFVYVGGATGAAAFDLSGAQLRTVALPGRATPLALAAVPGPSSLGPGAGSGLGAGGGGSAGKASPPATSTNPMQALAAQPVAGALLVAGSIGLALLLLAGIRQLALRRR